MRLLFDPAPTDGGGASPSNPAAPPSAPAPPPAPTTPTAPQTVTITLEQLQQFQAGLSTLAQLQTDAQRREAERAQQVADAQAQAGQAVEALQTVRTQHTGELAAERQAREAAERRARTFARDREIMADLAGRPLVPGAAKQLVRLLGEALDAHPEGDGFAVRTATFQGVKDYFDAELARPEYAHFLKPSTQGGAGANGGNRPTPSPAEPGAAPTNLGEAILAQAQQQQQAVRPGFAPVGLGRRR